MLTLLLTAQAFAQLPNTQVFVFDIVVQDTAVNFSKPMYLTGFNEKGYNNQPGWIDRNSLLLSVQMPGQAQPDIYSFDLSRRTKTRLTATESGEYSPKIMAGGQKFSVIRQERVNQDTVLRLWEFPLNLQNNGQPVFKNLVSTGYYEWLNSAQLAMFKVEPPNSIFLIGTDESQPRDLATTPGRCFRRQPNGNLAYVNKGSIPWTIVEQNLYRLNEKPVKITEVLPGSEDFAILSDGSYLMGQGSKIFRYDPIRTPRWVMAADLRLYGIRNISRIEVNTFGRLALVAESRKY